MEAQLAKDVVPFNFLTPMRIIWDAILRVGSPAPILVSEGAKTMDVERAVLVQTEPRTQLDAGAWGTMGAAVVEPEGLVVAVEGDSGFGFSAMELSDRRSLEEIREPFKDDPALTSFVPGAAYHILIEDFRGEGYLVGTPEELKFALSVSFSS